MGMPLAGFTCDLHRPYRPHGHHRLVRSRRNRPVIPLPSVKELLDRIGQPAADDHEPIVVVDDNDPTLMAPSSPSKGHPSPLLLTKLATYAQQRLAAGEGGDVLRGLGLDRPSAIESYRIGYLPAKFHGILNKADRQALHGQRIGNKLLLPAFDELGQVVDLFAVGVGAKGSAVMSQVCAEPIGLLAPTIATSASEIIVVDSIPILSDCIRQGFAHTLLLRGVADAHQNAERLYRSGVRRVILRTTNDSDGIAAALQATGIELGPRSSVTVPAAESSVSPGHAVSDPGPSTSSAPPLRITSTDRTAEVVHIDAGAIRYAVERTGGPRRLVVIRHQSQVAQDRIDLTSEPQRARFAGNAAIRLAIPASTIAAHLAELPALLADDAQAGNQRQQVGMSDEDRAAAEALLAAPDVLDRLVADLSTLGWIGTSRSQALLYLTAISRLLPQPLWTIHRGSAPWQGTALIAALTPPEDRLVFHRLTDAQLTQADPADLRHRLVVVDQAELLRPEAAIALRVLHERGGIGWATLAGAGVGEARGPVAVIAAAAGDLDLRCRDCFVTVPAEDDPAQTALILADQRRRHCAPAVRASDEAGIIARHHAVQRVLERRPVIIPDADRIVFPATRAQYRAEQAWFLGVVESIALLHQRQRQILDGHVVATVADIERAIDLTSAVLAQGGAGISRPAHALLAALDQGKLATFTLPDLAGIFPDWSRFAFRAAIQDLCDFGYLAPGPATTGGRGHCRSYARVTARLAPTTGIRMRAPEAPTIEAEVAKVAESGWNQESHFMSSPVKRLG
jgi:hypothetical protein